MGPTTRSSAANSRFSLEKITETKDPIQKHFVTEFSKLPLWRRALHSLYVEDLTICWSDRDKNHAILNTCIDPPYPDDLYETIVQIKNSSRKLITITIFHTTGTIRAQGNCCQKWVDEEFEILGCSVNKMAASMTAMDSTLDSCTLNLSSDVSVDCPPSPANETNQATQCAMSEEIFPTVSASDAQPSAPPARQVENSVPLPEDDASSVTVLGDKTKVNPDNGEAHSARLVMNDLHLPVPTYEVRPSPGVLPPIIASPASFPPVSPLFILMMQQQLADNTAVIKALKVELQQVRSELADVKHQCSCLHGNQTDADRTIRDNEVKASRDLMMTERILKDAIDSSVETFHQKHEALSERVSELAASKDRHASKIGELKKQQDALSKKSVSEEHSKASMNKPQPTPRNKAPELLTTSEHSRAISSPPRKGTETTTTTTLIPSISTGNSFSLLESADEDGNLGATATASACDDNSSDTQHPPESLPSPLEQLERFYVQADVNTLLIGDSTLKYVDERRMSVDGALVQKVSVSGLDIRQLMEWTRTLTPVPHIKRVTFHVGINSCGEGAVSKQTWVKLIRRLHSAFPRAAIQASSIVPPRGQHHLSKSVATSNNALKTACDEEKSRLIDNTPTFLTVNGAPRQSLYSDKIHPSREGSRKLALNIRFAGVPRRSPSRPEWDDNKIKQSRNYTGRPSYRQQHQPRGPPGDKRYQQHDLHQRQPPVTSLPPLSEEEFPAMPPPGRNNPPSSGHPFAAGPPASNRGWEQPTPSQSQLSHDSEHRMRMIAQLLQPYLSRV